jgi:HprK-related kinase A
MPVSQALPVFEWGLNLVIALRSHSFLMLHSAVLERNGKALLLPAMPGHGKTTLCAGLSHRGWRSFSDEFGLIRPGTHEMIPLPRPMALKNESIEVIGDFAPEAFIGPSTPNTRKGTVAHLKPTADSVARQNENAPVGMIVFPKWVKGASLNLRPISKGESFMGLATNAFNYELLGEAAFRTVGDLVSTADCYRLEYSDLEEATRRLNELADAN